MVKQDGWYNYVTVEDDIVVYRFHHEQSFHVTRHYERITWQRGRGIVHYATGIGSGRNHVEFGIDLYETYRDRRWINGVWFLDWHLTP
jgi:hypothetical protein